MAGKKAKPIILSEAQEKLLESFGKGAHTPMSLKKRAKIILSASRDLSNCKISKELSIKRDSVSTWRERYRAAYDNLAMIEINEPKKLKRAIIEVLSDAPRSGAPTTFTDVQVAGIIALSLQDPTEFGLPFSHWTPELLRAKAIELKIVESISESQIFRFLKAGRS